MVRSGVASRVTQPIGTSAAHDAVEHFALELQQDEDSCTSLASNAEFIGRDEELARSSSGSSAVVSVDSALLPWYILVAKGQRAHQKTTGAHPRHTVNRSNSRFGL